MTDSKDLARKALFTPCKTKEELDRWIRVFLQIRLPDKIVSEESNSSPLEMIWQLYDRAVRNDTEGWKRVMFWANRAGGKTLNGAILETILLLHTDRNIIHMAAIKDQSKKAQEYVKGFFFRPFFRDFVVGDNESEVSVVAYINKQTGVPVNDKEFQKLTTQEQAQCRRKSNVIRIIACTMQSTNGQHGEVLFIDEIDVIQKQNLRAYDQAKGGVPMSRAGMEAMTIFTSTRKSRVGKVQEEIDRAPQSGLRLNHWNVIDITEPCKPERHKPDEPKEPLWINDADVRHISDSEYEDLPDSEKSKWYFREGFSGCKTCPLFAACKTNLATNQTGKTGSFESGGTALLIPIPEVIDKFKDATPEFITTEYMCRKPDTSGLVFPRYNPEIHRLTASQIAEIVDGSPVGNIETKGDLIRYLAKRGAKFAAGMDFGYNHLFAVTTFAVWGNYAFVVDAIALPHQELDDKLEITEHLKELNVSIFADPEEAAAVATFRRRGYRIKEWNKGKGSVNAGIDICRSKLYTKALGATVFFLSGDPTIDLLCNHIRDYHYTTGPDGKFTETPEKTNDDTVDSWRYGIMSIFGKNGGLKVPNLGLGSVQEAVMETWQETAERSNSKTIGSLISGLTGGASGTGGGEIATTPFAGKRGKFRWDL